MKLDRNLNPDGRGKYALIKLRELHQASGGTMIPVPATDGMAHLPERFIDYGDTPETEFFVLRLKDKYAANALHAYAASCSKDDPEFSSEVRKLAIRAANHPNKQIPT